MNFAIPTRSPPPCDEDESDGDVFNEVEMEVADILLELPFLIAKLEAPLQWGTKRRRSALDSPPSPPPRRTERGPKFVFESSSPAMPLSFPRSESDERPQHSHKKPSNKRSREELLEIINESTQRKQCLTESVEKVKRHYEELLATNLALKQHLNFWRGRSQTQNLEIGQANLHGPYMVHQHRFILNQTMYGSSRLVVPHGAPNHNGSNNNIVSANDSLVMESPQPFDLTTMVVMMGNRTKAAEARKHRMTKMKHYFRIMKPMPSKMYT
ncbi:uncharacterized protein LOC132279443 [Cornus florida]|uniref:uncharacterized protein LOC132279443 n=1 Tax=Cornus florida TaxID=4283 RepID=UPI00289A5FBB|nr:uncharacterized protein LOC132279443 [Cornus florida]